MGADIKFPNIKDAILGAVEGLGKSVSSVLDSVNAPKELKSQIESLMDQKLLEHQNAILQIGEQHEEAILADTKNARDTNVVIQTSEKSGWLSKNIPYCLAIFISVVWGVVTLFIIARTLNLIAKDPSVHMDTVLAMYASITGLEMMILTFYFGSTQHSKDKDATIASMAANQN